MMDFSFPDEGEHALSMFFEDCSFEEVVVEVCVKSFCEPEKC